MARGNILATSRIVSYPGGNDAVGIPAGGTTGEVLTKDSNADYDVSWQPVGPFGDILQGGNSFGMPVVVGAADNQPFQLISNGVIAQQLNYLSQASAGAVAEWFQAGGNKIFEVTKSAFAENYLSVGAYGVGVYPTLTPNGPAANIGIDIAGKGTGPIRFLSPVSIGSQGAIPNYTVQVANNGTVNTYTQYTNNIDGHGAANGFLVGLDGTGQATLQMLSNRALIAYTNNTERWRTLATGEFLIGQTASALSNAPLQINSSSANVYFRFASSTENGFLGFGGTNLTLAHNSASGAERIDFALSGATKFWFSNQGNFNIGNAGGAGNGARTFSMGDATTVPTTNPASGGVMYAVAGALYWRGSAGTVTMIAPG